MNMPLVLVHSAGRTYHLHPSTDIQTSWFGGTGRLTFEGETLPRPLHLIANLNLSGLEIQGTWSYNGDVPLLFGIRYDDGGAVRYLFREEHITLVPPVPLFGADDWPYASYPDTLPQHPVEVTRVVNESWNSFAEQFPNLPTTQPAPLIIVVPPPQGLGFSLWGPEGDAEGVTLVFECDLAIRQVVAYNVCS